MSDAPPGSIWLCGGLDPTGGAGLLRDVATLQHLGIAAHCHCIVTVLTIQGHGAPARSFAVPPQHLEQAAAQLRAPSVVKIGLVDREAARVLSLALAPYPAVQVVIDPVLMASDGGSLGEHTVEVEALWQRANLLTPNFDEGQRLADTRSADPLAVMAALVGRFPRAAILLKGGHEVADRAWVSDRLHADQMLQIWTRPRVQGVDPRGTGCALATAITGRLAQGMVLREAVGTAIAWLDAARVQVRQAHDGRWHLRSGDAS